MVLGMQVMRAFAKELCAYRPWPRIFAILHCIISLLMAAVLWNPKTYIHHFKHIYLVWLGPDKLEVQAFDTVVSISILCSCSLLPYLHLRALQWFNVCRAGSSDLLALQHDLQRALEAVSRLKQRLLLSRLSQNADKFQDLGSTTSLQASSSASPSTSSTVSKHPRLSATPMYNQPQFASAAPVVDLDQPSFCKEQLGNFCPSRTQLTYDAQVAAPNSGNMSDELHQNSPQFPSKPLEMPSCYEPTAPKTWKHSSCRERQLAFSQTGPVVIPTTPDPQEVDHRGQVLLSPQLRSRAEAAIEASSTTIADLSQHLTVFVRVRTGANIQGPEACFAALSL